MSNELVVIEEATALQAFSTENGLSGVIQQARDEVENFEHDMRTAASRGRTATLANKVAKFKVKLDGMGKDLCSEWKTKAKSVDSNRKSMRDELDELKEIARMPLTLWENEQKEIEAVKAAKEAAEKLAAEIEQDHEIAILLDDKFNRDLADKLEKEAAERAELARIAEENRLANEARIKREATEKANREAEEKAKAEAARHEREKMESLQREEEAKQRAIDSERNRIAAEERAKYEAEQAEIRRVNAELKAIQDAKDAAERAKQEEINRQAEAKMAELERIAIREADINHKSSMMAAAKDAFMALGLSEEDAKIAVKAIVGNKIPAVKLSF